MVEVGGEGTLSVKRKGGSLQGGGAEQEDCAIYSWNHVGEIIEKVFSFGV